MPPAPHFVVPPAPLLGCRVETILRGADRSTNIPRPDQGEMPLRSGPKGQTRQAQQSQQNNVNDPSIDISVLAII